LAVGILDAEPVLLLRGALAVVEVAQSLAVPAEVAESPAKATREEVEPATLALRQPEEAVEEQVVPELTEAAIVLA
jgi:hypothetical protein